MNHVAILLEHVDLLNGLDRLNIQLLQRCLKLFVIRPRALVDLFDLPPRGTFTSITTWMSVEILQGAMKALSRLVAVLAPRYQKNGFGDR